MQCRAWYCVTMHDVGLCWDWIVLSRLVLSGFEWVCLVLCYIVVCWFVLCCIAVCCIMVQCSMYGVALHCVVKF